MLGHKTVVALVSVLLASGAAIADPFGSVVVYGDSLSDNGNLYALSGGTVPGSPYYMGRRSNGPVAVEYLASDLGAPLHDFAYIGATTGVGNYGDGGTPSTRGALGLPGMKTEYGATASLVPGFVSQNSLFVVWGGANDFLALPTTNPNTIITDAVANLVDIISGLQASGATHILVPGLPDLGLTPYFQSLGAQTAAAATAESNMFNQMLIASLPAGTSYFDTASLVDNIVGNPSAYGFSNVTDACYDGTTECSDPSQYLFFDSFHPTTQADQLLAQHFIAAVPEPDTLLMTALAGLLLSGYVGLSRSRAKRTRLR